MIKKLKYNSLNRLPPKVTIEQSQNNLFKNLYSPPKVIIEQSHNNLYKILNSPPIILKVKKEASNQNKITIPKIHCNPKKLNPYKLIKDKKRVNSMGKIIRNDNLENFFEKKSSFLFCPKNQELINYFDRQNRILINNLSMNNKIKNTITQQKITTIDSIGTNHNNKKTNTNDTSLTVSPPIRHKINKINKSSSLPNCIKNKQNFGIKNNKNKYL